MIPSWAELDLPQELCAELRTDHAGETGAVWIYRGILSLSLNPAVRRFAKSHLRAEQRHLAFFEAWLPQGEHSLLLPVWRLAGWLLGASSALGGSFLVYRSIDAVESMVDGHYAAQIVALAQHPRARPLQEQLQRFRAEECSHRDEARHLAPRILGPWSQAWRRLVMIGSQLGVLISRRI